MTEATLTPIVVAYLTTRLIELLKRWARLPFITASTDRLNQILGAIFAALATVGITVASDWDAATQTWTLVISGLSWTAGLSLLWQWGQQFVLQQLVYHGVVKPNEAARVTTLVVGEQGATLAPVPPKE